MPGVVIVGEMGEAGLRPVSLELVTAGRRLASALGGKVTAVLLGDGVGEAAAALAAAGADRTLVVDDPRLGHYSSELVTAALAAAVADLEPAVVLIPGTTAG